MWKLRLGLAALYRNAGRCRPDATLVDNLVSDCRILEKAGALMTPERVRMALVPVPSSNSDPDKPDPVAGEIAEVMIRQARLRACRLLPLREVEPFTLNVARQVGGFFASHREIRSVRIVTEALRSKRTRLIYGRVPGKLGVAICMHPVWGARRAGTWAASWQGRQEVLLQYLKLIYYELVLL